ncbi:MAG: pro-sigmaK processing inhibitor BofA family protein [Heliobacteriaceae bacterium]|nr:pro-sigmaK processing inhibitor BofA family protein [Heliobacteriaceae bacterium]MDD4587718.1 pro-sigmaK processing inhibitor BofA family protein [Heliobacteriaceae bacterium]
MNVTAEGLALTGLGALFLMAAGSVFLRPLRWVFKLAFNSLLGLLMLAGTNLLGGPFGFTLPVNLFTALLVGCLGLPGFLLVIMLQYLLS